MNYKDVKGRSLEAFKLWVSNAERYWVVIFFIAITLLFLHTFSLFSVTIDTTSIMLLFIIMLCPFINSIYKFKFGDFEIERSEVLKVTDDVEKITSQNIDDHTHTGLAHERFSIFDKDMDMITSLVERDHILSLAKLRMEIEKNIRLYMRLAVDPDINEYAPLNHLITELFKNGILKKDVVESLKNVLSICNRAVHGAEIHIDDAKKIINSGVSLLEGIRIDLELHVMSGTVIEESEVHDLDYELEYYSKKYLMTTITPTIPTAKKRVRELNQEQLDNYLDGYNEFAEFIVELKVKE